MTDGSQEKDVTEQELCEVFIAALRLFTEDGSRILARRPPQQTVPVVGPAPTRLI
jgi:hypothetical protein